MAAVAARHSVPRSGAGSRVGETSEPVPNSFRAAIRAAITASTVATTTGRSHGVTCFSSPTEAKSSPVSSSRVAASSSPATDR